MFNRKISHLYSPSSPSVRTLCAILTHTQEKHNINMKNNPKELIDDLRIIRTIHSNKARVFAVYNFYYLIITIIVAVIVTFIGFTGPQTIADFLSTSPNKTDSKNLKLIMDLMTLSILVISILSLILKFEQKGNKHNNAVTRLTEFISQVEFTYLGGNISNPTSFTPADIGLYAEKYKSIINSLPATKDSDYIYALKTIKKKKKIKTFIESSDYDQKNFITRKWHILWI